MFNKEASLPEMFNGISVYVVQELEKIKQEGQEPGDREDYGGVFDNFTTPEYFEKILRVRPQSGVTHGDETKDGRQSNVSRGGAAVEGGEDPEDNQNKMFHLDLEEQRKKVKKEHRDRQDEIKKKKMLEEKAAEAKKKM